MSNLAPEELASLRFGVHGLSRHRDEYVLLTYLRTDFRSKFFDIGIIGSAYAFAYALTPLTVGYLSDKYSRLWMFAIGIVLNALASVLLVTSSKIADIVVLQALAGVGSGFFWPTAEALAIDLAPVESRIRSMGFYSVVWASGFLIGPSLAGLTVQFTGFTSLFIVSGTFMALATVPAILFVDPRHQLAGPSQSLSFLRNLPLMRKMLPWYLMSICYGIVFSVISTILPAYTNIVGIAPTTIGFLFAAFGVTRVILLVASGRWLIFGERRSLILASCLISICFFTLVISSDFVAFLVSMILLGACFGVIYPITISLISRHFPREMVGLATGSYETSYGTGFAIGPLLAGLVAALTSVTMAFIMTSIFGALMMVLVFLGRADEASIQGRRSRTSYTPSLARISSSQEIHGNIKRSIPQDILSLLRAPYSFKPF